MIDIIIACSVSSISAAILCALIGPKLIHKYSKPLSLIAVGFLITLAVSHIIPEAMEQSDPHEIGFVVLVAILLLTFCEMIFNSNPIHECHESEHVHAIKNGVGGILFGSAMHTFCDGLIIASAFLTSTELGIAVTVAVISHEIAHELGDYAIAVDCGMTTTQAFIVNIIALLGCVVGGLVGYFVLSKSQSLIPCALALSGASFIYVSLSDLLPRLRQSENKTKVFFRILFMLIGVVLSLLIAHHD